MQATEILMNEHRLIEQVLTCLERMAQRCAAGDGLDPEMARGAVWFLRTFADTCHHGKEEAELFPLMESRGFSSEQGPTAVMRIEHDEGRRLVGCIDQAIAGATEGDDAAIKSFTLNAHNFVELLRAHIQKEDECLFPMAGQALNDQDRASLERRFAQVDDRNIGRDVIDKCHRVANAMADRLGVSRAFPSGETADVN